MKGKVHVYDVDNIDTDRIIPGKYTKTLDMSVLAEHCLEDLDENFNSKVTKGDILVAGENFGCGSSREQAPVAIKVAGIYAVIAKSFARIFYRNAINVGLPILEIADHSISPGIELDIDLQSGIVKDLASGKVYQSAKMPKVMIDILEAGGLVSYLSKYGDYKL